ncbi:hypothetical protein RRG08_064556 [Elysia crispata]|uniref:Uncharacterized protein n=1 Tax=Elysia crispata TaxID=231223 RepID=A0AAE1ECK0_9GAST|nr:hypothetical protein RRG08_064556 [Elysia crispata]
MNPGLSGSREQAYNRSEMTKVEVGRLYDFSSVGSFTPSKNVLKYILTRVKVQKPTGETVNKAILVTRASTYRTHSANSEGARKRGQRNHSSSIREKKDGMSQNPRHPNPRGLRSIG